MKQASQWVVVDFNPADGTGTGKIFRRVMNGTVPAEPEEYSITGTGPRKLAAAGTTQKDFSAINQGQLKAVAKPFYDRLAELFAAFGGYAKPWTDATADDTSFAVASIGQLKNVFACNRDSDSDGMTDLFELTWGNRSGRNPEDDNVRIK